MKAIKLDIYQEQAHFREPKILNVSLLTTIPLPPPTTIVGMLTHLRGQRFNEIIDIGIIGKFESVRTDFQRTERSSWLEFYIKGLTTKTKNVSFDPSLSGPHYESFQEYKKRKKLQGISTYEILYDGHLTIFIKSKQEKTLNEIYLSLKNPSYYVSLGRKEDFARIESVEIIEIEENVEISKKEAMKNDYILKNTYVPVKFKVPPDEFSESVAKIGTLYALPRIYSDIYAPKKDRKYVYHHYIHIGEQSYYLDGCFNRYQKTIFKWLVQTGEENDTLCQN